MAKEWIDIVDTAIKIGLGALITGFFTYIGLKFSKKSEMNKFSIEHKTRLLEGVSTDITEYFSAWETYSNQVAGIARHRATSGKENEELNVKQRLAMKKCEEKLISSRVARESSIGKLRIISANEAAELLTNCNIMVCELRDQIVFEKKFPKYEAVKIYIVKAKREKDKLHRSLADFYEKIIH